MISPFWSNNDIIFGSGDIFYRQISRDTASADDMDLFDLIDDLIIRSGAVDVPNEAVWMLIVTWDHVGYTGSDHPGCVVSSIYYD